MEYHFDCLARRDSNIVIVGKHWDGVDKVDRVAIRVSNTGEARDIAVKLMIAADTIDLEASQSRRVQIELKREQVKDLAAELARMEAEDAAELAREALP